MKYQLLVLVLFLLAFSCKTKQTPNGNVPKENAEMTENPIKEEVPIKTIPIVSPENFGNAAKNYAEYCAGCHGVKMEAFADVQRGWKHGTSKEAIAKSIKVGIPKNGMPSYDTTFTDKEIEHLAAYIHSGVELYNSYGFESEPDNPTVFETSAGKVKAELVFDRADIPWGFAILPNGDLLVSDRKGDLYLKQGQESQKLKNVPAVKSTFQGGLLDVELHPNYAENGWIYVSYSKPNPKGGDGSTTAIFRAKISGNSLTDVEDIFVATPYLETGHHYGSKLFFDKNGYLFFTVGDRGKRDDNPQSLKNHCGKVHRIKDDGAIPEDNPFVNVEGAMKSIYSYGHRNPQGLVINMENGTIWESEHGPRGGDELNIVIPGKNYGWPIVSYGINYNGTTFTDKTSDSKFKGPETYWVPSIAPCGMTMITNDKYGDWKGDVLIGSLRFDYVNKVSIKDDVILGEEQLFPKIGRVRNVEMGPDGFLYVAVEDPGRVYKMVPVQ